MSRTGTDVATLAIAFATATGLAELLGAANLGTAMAFGTMAFTLALVAVMLRSA